MLSRCDWCLLSGEKDELQGRLNLYLARYLIWLGLDLVTG